LSSPLLPDASGVVFNCSANYVPTPCETADLAAPTIDVFDPGSINLLEPRSTEVAQTFTPYFPMGVADVELVFIWPTALLGSSASVQVTLWQLDMYGNFDFPFAQSTPTSVFRTGYVDFPFPSNPQLSKGQTYAFVVDDLTPATSFGLTTGDDSNPLQSGWTTLTQNPTGSSGYSGWTPTAAPLV
jgi:hypothetical protein